jgi:hypothetical protein
MSVPEDSGVELAIFIVTLHIMQVRRSISGLLSSFALITSAFNLRLGQPADGDGLGPQLVARNIGPIAKQGTPDRNRA